MAGKPSAHGTTAGLRINRGPPSRIVPFYDLSRSPLINAARSVLSGVKPPAVGNEGGLAHHGGGPAKPTRRIRAAREEATASPRTRAAGIARGHGSRSAMDPSVAYNGHRINRRVPLSTEKLYVDDARPPLLNGAKPHHLCSLCGLVKSHPMSYRCGHSHCYVCIRLALEKSWACPSCGKVMLSPPFRHYGEEASIRVDYPEWIDHSRVVYSWDGLTFPRTELIVVD